MQEDYRAVWQWSKEYLQVVRPEVQRLLRPWQALAQTIPDPVLRQQALASLSTKKFHCEGGAVLAGPCRDPEGRVLEFLVPYQTLCDYLDTVTDRGPSNDPVDLNGLHQSLLAAVDPRRPLSDFYRWHPQKSDGGYVRSLLEACRTALSQLPGYVAVAPEVEQLARYYIDLQVLKHGPIAQRTDQLQRWYHDCQGVRYGLHWWEFAAAAGSTLGIFALLNRALQEHPARVLLDRTVALYFPWMGALHILLDYYIDQAEDLLGGDLNFVACYRSQNEIGPRLSHIYQKTLEFTHALPDGPFHRYIARGLLGFYFADAKVGYHLSGVPWRLLRGGGVTAVGLYIAARHGRSP